MKKATNATSRSCRPFPALSAKEQQIVRLRKAGCSNKEIARELALPYRTVGDLAVRLIREGHIQQLPRGKFVSQEEYVRRETEVLKLREAGLSYEEIAETLGISSRGVGYIISKLLAESKTKPLPSTTMDAERVQTIINLRRAAATLDEIAVAVGGVTRERARQLVNRVAKNYGADVIALNTELWTINEVASKLNFSPDSIYRLCHGGHIPCRRRGNRGYLLNEESIIALKAHPLFTHRKTCAVCGKEFAIVLPQTMARLVCSNTCAQRRRDEQRAAMAVHPPTLDSLRGWQKELWQELQDVVIPTDEKWVGRSDAVQRTCLSRMQLTWLRYRNIVVTRPHPSKTWRGKPQYLFAASQMRVARRVYQAFLKKKKQPRQRSVK